MKYKVNDSCIGCGLCESTCPEVFSIQGDVAVAIEGEVPGSAISTVLMRCPNSRKTLT